MFDICLQVMTQFVQILPIFLVLYLIFDFLGSFFFGGK